MEQTTLYLTYVLQLDQSPSNINLSILLYPKAFGSFQFHKDTRSNFSFSSPTTPQLYIVWGPDTLIYLGPKHIFGLSLLHLHIQFPLLLPFTLLSPQEKV